MRVAAPAWCQVAARVARHAGCGAQHRWLDLEMPTGFATPEPGQFVQLYLGSALSPVLLPRPMSVTGVKRRAGRLTLTFLYASVGLGTRALAALETGASVQVLGPLGRGFPLARPGTPVLVAGGRGVAPLLFAADVLARRGRRSEFLFGARSRAQLVGLDEARRRMATLGGRLRVSTDDGSRGVTGSAVDLLEQVSRRLAPPIVIHACGPHAMLKAVAHWAMARGAEAWLAMESMMACGTGVCRGCALPRSEAGRVRFAGGAPSLLGSPEFAMCCTEGPVFEARDLDWERIP